MIIFCITIATLIRAVGFGMQGARVPVEPLGGQGPEQEPVDQGAPRQAPRHPPLQGEPRQQQDGARHQAGEVYDHVIVERR